MDTITFDRLLRMTMLSLDDHEYQNYLRQMDQIISYMDTIKNVDTTQVDQQNNLGIDVDRDYPQENINLSNVKHPITGNMLQIKFKRG